MRFEKYTLQPLFRPEQVTPVSGFDGVFYINCPEAEDRNRTFLAEARAHQLKPLRIEGVIPSNDELTRLGYGCPPYSRKTRGHAGCIASHFRAIAEARRLGLQSVVIFEDDATFCEGWENKVGRYFDALGKIAWNLAYFGAMPSQQNERINERLIRTRGAWTTHAYAMNSNYFDRFLNFAKNPIKAIDCLLFHRAELDQFFLYAEPLNFQHDGTSSISGGKRKNLRQKMIDRYREFC